MSCANRPATNIFSGNLPLQNIATPPIFPHTNDSAFRKTGSGGKRFPLAALYPSRRKKNKKALHIRKKYSIILLLYGRFVV